MKNRNVLMLITLVTALSVGACGNNTDVASVEGTEVVSTTESIDSVIIETEVIEPTETAPSTEVVESEEIVEVEDPAIESTETAPSTESTETIESEVLNEEVVINSMADLEEGYQKLRESWERKATWTASNGVTIKINDAWADAIDDGTPAAIYYDGTEDLTPNSPFMQACNEYVYGDEAYLNGTDRWNPEVVDVSQLPDIPCASSKQTSVPNSSEFTAYKEAFDYMYGFQASGKWGATPAYCLQNYGSGIGLTAMASGYLFEMNYDGSEWIVTIRKNLSELQWDALHNSLRLVSPDGDAVYNAIYDVSYYDVPWILDCDGWYAIPSTSSEIYVTDTTGLGYMEYRFR